jgi:hypothetical protein
VAGVGAGACIAGVLAAGGGAADGAWANAPAILSEIAAAGISAAKPMLNKRK